VLKKVPKGKGGAVLASNKGAIVFKDQGVKGENLEIGGGTMNSPKAPEQQKGEAKERKRAFAVEGKKKTEKKKAETDNVQFCKKKHRLQL